MTFIVCLTVFFHFSGEERAWFFFDVVVLEDSFEGFVNDVWVAVVFDSADTGAPRDTCLFDVIPVNYSYLN